MLKVVSAMRISLTMVIIAIAMLASPLAYGQARTSGKPSGPAVGGGDRSLIPSTQPAVAPPGGTLSDLAGGGDADPNYVPPGERSKKSTRHRVVGAPRVHTSHRFEQYSAYPAFAFGYYCWYCAY